jgi:hypothetical protein
VARPLTIRLVAFALVALAGGCPGPGARNEPFPEACGLPSPGPKADVSKVPEDFLLDGEAVVRKVSRQDGLLVIALNVPLTIREVYDRYSEALVPPEYEPITDDFEGFEAEIYLRQTATGSLLAIQARRPQCEEASSVFITINENP